MIYPIITAEEAAEFVKNGDNVGVSGFTAPGCPKAVAPFIAAKARREHEAGREFKINIFSGASTNDFIDGELTRAEAINISLKLSCVQVAEHMINCNKRFIC